MTHWLFVTAAVLSLVISVELPTATAIGFRDHRIHSRVRSARIRQSLQATETVSEGETAQIEAAAATDATAHEGTEAGAELGTEIEGGMAALRHRLGLRDGTVAEARAYDSDHLVVCTQLSSWIGGVGAAHNAATDAVLLGHWNTWWDLIPNNDAKRRNPVTNAYLNNNGRAHTLAAQIVTVVRHRRGTHGGNVCKVDAITVAVAAHEVTYEHQHVDHYTLGLEWEFHFVEARPGVTRRNAVWNFAESGHNNQDPLLGNAPWILLASDHGSPGGNAATIVELSFAPMKVDSADNTAITLGAASTPTGGGLTAKALYDQVSMTRNLKEALVIESLNAGNAGAYDFATITAIAAEYHRRNGGASGGWKTIGAAADYQLNTLEDPHNCYNHLALMPNPAPPPAQINVRACNAHNNQNEWAFKIHATDFAGLASAAFRTTEYVQTNYLAAVSSLASTAFQTIHLNTTPFKRAFHDAIRTAARAWVRTFPDLATLSNADKADVLGVCTQWLAHIVFHGTVNHANARFPRNRCDMTPGGTNKNFFDHMIKSHTLPAVLQLSPLAQDVLYHYISSTNWAAGNPEVNVPLGAIFTLLENEFTASADANVAWWGGQFTNTAAVKVDVTTVMRARMPSLLASTPLGGARTSPTGGGGAGVSLRVGGGNNGGQPGVIGVVIESRKITNALNTASVGYDVNAVNAILATVQKQFAWDGGAATWPA